jgi:hypothetical protein
MMRSVARIVTLSSLLCAFGTPAVAQVQLQALGGVTSAAEKAPFYAGALGIRISFLEIDGEVGRYKNILPKGIVDIASRLQEQLGQPVQVIAALPATFADVNVRLISPGGLVRPFVNGGYGVAHLEPRLDVLINGINITDVFGVDVGSQNRQMVLVGAGLRVDFGVVNVEGGYRFVAIFSKFNPDTNFRNDSILTSAHCVYGGVAIRF